MSSRIGDIEILRAVAVLGVVLHHAHGNLITAPIPVFDWLAEHFDSWWGVDLFFVISGFVIARSLVPTLKQSPTLSSFAAHTVTFWLRRGFRLLPSAWLWLAVVLVACVYFNQSGVFRSFADNLEATLAGVFYYANFRFADSFMNYEYGASFVYWSLSLEEQFYLLLPLVVLLSRRWLVWVILLVIVVQFFTWRSVFLMCIRSDAIAWGVLLALVSNQPWYRTIEPRFLRNKLVATLVFASLLAALMHFSTQSYLWSFWRVGVVALLCAILVWVASYDRDYWNLVRPIRALGLWLGARSYSLYLIHIPAFFAARELFYRLYGPGDWSATLAPEMMLVATCGLLLATELNYRFIETPCREFGQRWQQARRQALRADKALA